MLARLLGSVRWLLVAAMFFLPTIGAEDGGLARAITLGEGTVREGAMHVGGLSLALASVGRGDAIEPMAGHDVSASEREVRIERAAGVVEWWRAVAEGLEHGVTLAERASGEGPLVLSLSLGAGVHAEQAGSEALRFASADGIGLATYSHLVVIDANGEHVPARLLAAGEHARIEVDDERARYPLVVDPLVATLEGTLALTSTLIIGPNAFMDATGTRALVVLNQSRIYRRDGATWVTEHTFGGGTYNATFDDSGTRALVRNASLYQVWARTGTTWAMEASISADVVAISGDGASLVGIYGTSGSYYTRSGSTWTLASSFTTATSASIYPPIDLDRTGATLLFDSRIYTRTGSTWDTGVTLTAPSGARAFGLTGRISGTGRASSSVTVTSRPPVQGSPTSTCAAGEPGAASTASRCHPVGRTDRGRVSTSREMEPAPSYPHATRPCSSRPSMLQPWGVYSCSHELARRGRRRQRSSAPRARTGATAPRSLATASES